jgi:hypothetical protein
MKNQFLNENILNIKNKEIVFQIFLNFHNSSIEFNLSKFLWIRIVILNMKNKKIIINTIRIIYIILYKIYIFHKLNKSLMDFLNRREIFLNCEKCKILYKNN